MTTLTDRPGTALLVIDVQNGVMAASHDTETVVGRIEALVARAREEHVPVVWVQHSSDELPVGSEQWEYVPQLQRADGEALVAKQHGDSFEATDLEQVLADARVGRLVVTGAQTDACIRSTIHGAFTRGYDVTLVGDAHTTEDLTAYGAPAPGDVISHTNLYWGFQTAPGRTAAVVPAADVAFTG
jgi:nicotinamidase-related amidase